MHIMCFTLFVVVEVQVDDTTLITTERLDTSVLVCFSQISGSQDRPITYYTSTSDVTAMGKRCIFIHFMYMCIYSHTQ